ncbi:MAG: hypothetical protein ACK8QZ_01955 [Anaerolineales bacterium]
MNYLRLFGVLWGTFGLSWGFFSAQANLLGWGALVLGVFSLLAIREYWERFPRFALIIAFGLAMLGVLGGTQGGWMMVGVLGYATFLHLTRLRSTLLRLPSKGTYHAGRLGVVHFVTFLVATFFSWLEKSLSPIWYVAWALDLLVILFFIYKFRE